MVVSKKLRSKRGYKQTVGNFSSYKMKTIVWYDSALKRDFMYWLEFEPDVISYATPAISFDYYELGKLKQYVPDFQVIRRHKKQIIDVKSKKTLQSNRYRQLYQHLSRICDEKGWTFIALTESEVRLEPIFSNIKLLKLLFCCSLEIDLKKSIQLNSAITAVSEKIDWERLLNV
jgi:hypothetical protein